MVAHLIPTLYFWMASAESIVIWSLVWCGKRVTALVAGRGSARAGGYAGKPEGTHGISGLKSKVVVLDVEVDVGENEL